MLNIPKEVKKQFFDDNLREQNAKKLKLQFFDRVDTLYPMETLYPSDTLFPFDKAPWLTIGHDRIDAESLELTESLCDEEDIVFGACTASQCKITIADVPEDVTGKEFLLTIEVDGYEMTMGIYRVESFVRQADRRLKTITAYDRMRLFHPDVVAWYNNLTFPMTLKALRNSLCEYVGVDQIEQKLILDDMEVTKTIEPGALSGLDLLEKICEINGVFGQFEHTGYLKYMSLAQTGLWPSETLYPAENLFPSEATGYGAVPHYKSLTYEDYLVNSIDKLQIRQEEGDIGISVGEGMNCYTIEGNFLVYGKSASDLLMIASTVYDAIGGRMYRPCVLECPAMPWLEVGDGFSVQTSNDMIESFILKRTIKGIQAMMDTLEAAGNETREEDFGFQSQIIQLQGKTAVIKKSMEKISVDLTDLAADTASKFEQTAEQILMKVSKGEVSSQLSIEPDKVTISGNRLIVNSTNFQLDGDGNATFSGNVKGASIKGGTLYGTDINVGLLWADDSVVQIGGFEARTAWGRDVFQSYDETTGMSANPYSRGQLHMWAGWRSDSDYAFAVNNRKEVHCYEIYIESNKSFWQGWSLSRTVEDLYDRVQRAEDAINDLRGQIGDLK